MKYADSTQKTKEEIRLVDETGKKHRMIVPPGMMDDIVRPLWDFPVVVLGTLAAK